jgi:predicted permease
MNRNKLSTRLRALAYWRRCDQDLNDELSSHVEMQTRKNLTNDMEATEARRQALIQFGGLPQITEECRDARGVNWITAPCRDALYALRGFRHSPIFVIAVVATISLGLGIDTALFTIFNAYYFAPVHVREPYSLYDVAWRDRAGDFHGYSWPEYQEFLKRNPAFSEALGYQGTEVRMNDRRAFGLLVTDGYFRMLGGQPALGRTLFPEDAASARTEPVVVLSFSTWKNQFGGNPNIIGKTIFLHGYPFEVTGVTQSGFRGLGARPVDFWAPLTTAARFNGGPDLFGAQRPRSLSIVARLKPEYELSQARAGVTLWSQRLTADGPDPEKATQGILASVATYKPWRPGNTLRFAPILVAFSLVLIMGCANVASMMLARAVSRQREFGIRLSLGASRIRLICQLMTESTILALPAAAVGFGVSQAMIWLCSRVLLATLPPGIADFADRLPVLSPDIRVFVYNLAVAFLSALLFGLAPAMQATQGDFANAFRTSRLRNALVVGEVTVCVLLLITTGILLRGVNQVKTLDGFLSNRDTIEVGVQDKFRARAIDRLSSEPSVDILAAAATSPVGKKQYIAVAAYDGGPFLQVAVNSVSPEYFPMFELPVVFGRNFTVEEARTGAPVAVISQTTAKLLWPYRDAVGQSLSLAPDRKTAPRVKGYRSVRVIGISRDEISRWITNGEEKTLVYFPTTARVAGNTVFIGVHGDVETARRQLDSDLAAIDPAAVDEIHRFQLRNSVAEEAYSFRVAYWTAAAIGVLALLLTLTGIYGVVAFVVSQRTKEIGIRMALGATSGAVSGLMLKQSMRLALIGTLAGATLALGMSKALASSMVMIRTFDGLTYIGGVLFVLVACAAAAYFPIRRATRIDPITTLRYD